MHPVPIPLQRRSINPGHGAPCFLDERSLALALIADAFEFSIERGALDAQDRRGAVLLAAGESHGCLDVFEFQLLERFGFEHIEGFAFGRFSPGYLQVGKREVFGFSEHTGRQNVSALTAVFEFANVAWPVVLKHCLLSPGREAGRSVSGPSSKLLQEELSQREDVIAALSQGWNRQFDDTQAEVQIGAEVTFFDGCFEVAVGRRDDADIDANGFAATDAFEHLAFKHAEEFGLDLQAHFAEFIQHQRTAVRKFEFAKLAFGGSGECTFLVTEQFAFQQGGSEGGAIDRNERSACPQAAIVDGASDEFFARTAFAANQNGCLGGGDALDLFPQSLHAIGATDPIAMSQLLLELLQSVAGREQLAFQRLLPHEVLERHSQDIGCGQSHFQVAGT